MLGGISVVRRVRKGFHLNNKSPCLHALGRRDSETIPRGLEGERDGKPFGTPQPVMSGAFGKRKSALEQGLIACTTNRWR